MTPNLTRDLLFKSLDRQASLTSKSQSVAPGPVDMQIPETKLPGACSNILFLTSPFIIVENVCLRLFFPLFSQDLEK